MCTGRATSCSDKSLRVYWRIFVKIFVSETEFCRYSKSQKIMSDWICATCCGNKILLQLQRFSQKFSSTHGAICRCNVSLRHVAATCRLVCTDLHVVFVQRRLRNEQKKRDALAELLFCHATRSNQGSWAHVRLLRTKNFQKLFSTKKYVVIPMTRGRDKRLTWP